MGVRVHTQMPRELGVLATLTLPNPIHDATLFAIHSILWPLMSSGAQAPCRSCRWSVVAALKALQIVLVAR